MELVAITLARVVSLVQLQAWDPFGKATSLETLQGLIDRYTFAKYPTTFDALDPQKGIELVEGRLGNIVIHKIAIYSNGLVIDTRSSTDDSETVLQDMVQLAHDAFGANIKPVQQNFVSQFIFRSNLRLSALNPVMGRLGDVLTKKVSTDMKQVFEFEPTAISIHTDLSNRKITPAMFSVERRVDVPFSEDTYFSNAPLRTSDHIEVVNDFEASLLGGNPA